jgi:tetratricopeptide (TPR) repeat protein
MTRGRGPAFAAAFALLCALAGPAAAEDQAEGRRQYRRGEELLKTGDYRSAADAFEAGYAAAPRPGFLLNIGNCYRKLGDLGKARQYYRRFLDDAPANHASRGEVLGYLRQIDEIEADGLAVGGASPAAVPAPPAPVPASLMLAEPAPPPAARPLVTRWWFWGLVGGALAAGAAAYVLSRGPGGPACHASLGCVRE